jgi:hypothetical protein
VTGGGDLPVLGWRGAGWGGENSLSAGALGAGELLSSLAAGFPWLAASGRLRGSEAVRAVTVAAAVPGFLGRFGAAECLGAPPPPAELGVWPRR